ncbi:hypothetical protein [Nocardia brasiliensis]|uniref:hypothetical protein n=1 Tax=Nocardia brasiliensis TaxID=37326 RepID=UPI00366DF50C
MTGIDTRSGTLADLGDTLLVLDPDLEQLFAEVDTILCEAHARLAEPRRASVPVPGPRPRASPRVFLHPDWLRGRSPGTGRATQRGPPPPR